jgi:dihydrodipicolinate synthase/N-acetylneuraminate lyase
VIRYPRTIMATCCVPWTAAYELNEPVFRRTIRHLVDNGLRDLYVFGTAGEGHAVNDRQFAEIVDVYVDESARLEIVPMVGVISMSTTTVIERIEAGIQRGVGRFQISLPSWGTLTEAETATFFQETCGRFPNAQFLHYNLRRSGRLIEADEYARLAERHPNLVATKNSGADVRMLATLLDRAGMLRHFVTEPGFSYGPLFGECGFLISISSINPALVRAYYEAGLRRDGEELGRLARELALMTDALLAAADPGVHLDSAFDKVFNKLHDPEFDLRLLPPYRGFSDDAFNRFRETVIARFPNWAAGFAGVSAGA